MSMAQPTQMHSMGFARQDRDIALISVHFAGKLSHVDSVSLCLITSFASVVGRRFAGRDSSGPLCGSGWSRCRDLLTMVAS